MSTDAPMTVESTQSAQRAVAVVGMACRFPGASDAAAFRQLIHNGTVCTAPVPVERCGAVVDPAGQDPHASYSGVGAFLEDVTRFPARHFGIPPRRAQVMDPQQRLLLQVVREAYEDAGLDPERHAPATGVFVGASSTNFRDLLTAGLRTRQAAAGRFGSAADPNLAAALVDLVTDVPPPRAFTMTGTLQNMVAAVVTQTFDLHGPSFVVDAACSSSLLAMHEAIAHLRSGSCDLAIVGGVHVTLVPDAMVGFSRIGALSRAGASRPFDERADGFVLGEGCGAVLLRPLADALADGDKVYARILGSGVSNDGRAAGPMAPDAAGQALALRRAYDDARIDPRTVEFVEAHGTGTAVGDAVEVAALRQVVAVATDDEESETSVCWLSSVKANIGHTMAAAGIAGFVKAALVLGEGIVPPQPAPLQLRGDLGLGAGRLRVATERHRWPPDTPRRGAVSSFGFGGANAHVVLEATPPPPGDTGTTAAADLAAVVVLNCASIGELPGYAEALADHVALDGRLDPATVARDLAARPRRPHRLAVVATTRLELADRLRQAAAALRRGPSLRLPDAPGCFYGEVQPDRRPGSVTFVYPGQGSQSVGALRDLYDGIPAFRHRLHELNALAEEESGTSPLSVAYPAHGADLDPETAAGLLADTATAQPVLAIQSVGLTELLARAGLRPHQSLGHSLGELCALSGAGLLDPEQLVPLAAHRGLLMAKHAPADRGTMAALHCPPGDVAPLLAGLSRAWVANLNGPRQVVVSGDHGCVAEVSERARAVGIRVTPLAVSHAFHSPLVEEAGRRLVDRLRGLRWQASDVPVFSAVTGERHGGAEDTLAALERHATAPVDFVAAVAALSRHVDQTSADHAGPHVVVHVGAGRSGLGLVRSALPDPGAAVFVQVADDAPDRGATFAEALATLLVLGHDVDALVALPHRPRQPIALPPGPLPVEDFPLPGSVSTGQRRSMPIQPITGPPWAGPTPDVTTATRARPSSDRGPAMTDIVALFHAQTEVLRLQLAGATAGLGHGEALKRPGGTSDPHEGASPTAPRELREEDPPAPPGDPRERAAPAAPTTTGPARGSGAATIQLVVETVAGISGYPADVLEPHLRLVDDLGFDSIMVAELIERLQVHDPGASRIAEGFGRQTCVADIAEALTAPQPSAPETPVAAQECDRGGDSQPPWPQVAAQRDPVPLAPAGGRQVQPGTPPESTWRIEQFPEVTALRGRLDLEHQLQLRNPYFSIHERVVADTTRVDGRDLVNFSSYNYLGLAGDPRVAHAAGEAVDRYGTSVSASRLLSGDRPLHRELEAELADTLGAQAALVLVSGHATNVTTIASLVGAGDLIVHDALAHDSIIQGAKLSGAVRRSFPHADPAALDSVLRDLRPRFRRVLVAVEGVYSQDGDIVDLPAFVEVKRRHGALLYVDEAHSLGTIGATGAGVGEHFGVDPADVDVWMGTLSKSLASCGGYVAGSAALVEYLKYTSPGFIYSVGLPPPSAAAALTALRVMRAETWRVARLREVSGLFLTLAKEAGVNTGLSRDSAVVPCIVGGSERTLVLAQALFDRGINVNPILYPAVEQDQTRLRFFLTSAHSDEQVRSTVQVLAEELGQLSTSWSSTTVRPARSAQIVEAVA